MINIAISFNRQKIKKYAGNPPNTRKYHGYGSSGRKILNIDKKIATRNIINNIIIPDIMTLAQNLIFFFSSFGALEIRNGMSCLIFLIDDSFFLRLVFILKRRIKPRLFQRRGQF